MENTEETVKVDCHIHTKYSPDSATSLALLKKICEKKGLIPSITDHNTIRGALAYKALSKDFIVGEEIETAEGEIIGLFLNEEIPKGLSIEETVDKIREQDGVIYVPHPFDFMRPSTIKRLNFPIDVVEIFNSRILKKTLNMKAIKFAEENNKLMGVGSDAHLARDIGISHIKMLPFSSKGEFLHNLKKAELVTNYCCLSSVLASRAIAVLKMAKII